jgi:phospholipase/carboxylesterase
MRTESMGGLRVRIMGGEDREGGGEGPAVVLLHGFGAPGDDLVALARVLDVPRFTRFVFPEGPLSVPGYGGARAWWMIDVERIARRERGEDLSGEVPEGMSEAREKAIAMLDAVDATLRPSRVVLGGFSQGAMLSCDVALRTERPLAGLALLSGTLVAEDEWTPLMPRRKGLPVFASHGRSDPLLPFATSERLRSALNDAGLPVRWMPFSGGHEIPPGVLGGLAAFLKEVTGAAFVRS